MSFRLIRDTFDGSLEPLEIPAGVSYLTRDLAVSSRRPRTHTPVLVFEEVRRAGRPALVAFCPSEERVRLNGTPMPVLAALEVKDQLQLGDGALLHVSAYREGLLDAPPRAGRTCPVCRTAIDTGATYACPCGTLLHCNDELECARLSTTCPSCQAAIRLDPGMVYVPET